MEVEEYIEYVRQLRKGCANCAKTSTYHTEEWIERRRRLTALIVGVSVSHFSNKHSEAERGSGKSSTPRIRGANNPNNRKT